MAGDWSGGVAPVATADLSARLSDGWQLGVSSEADLDAWSAGIALKGRW